MVPVEHPTGGFDLGERQVEMIVQLEIVEGIRPGTVALSWHYGPWAYGSHEIRVDGLTIPGDGRRAAGGCPNPLRTVDPILGDGCLTEPVGASASFFDTRVQIHPVTEEGV